MLPCSSGDRHLAVAVVRVICVKLDDAIRVFCRKLQVEAYGGAHTKSPSTYCSKELELYPKTVYLNSST